MTPSAKSMRNHILMGNLLDPQFTVPLLSNSARQPVGSNACGCYVLHYMEQEIRLLRGEWPSVWLESGWKSWKLRLEMAEQKSITDAAKLRWVGLQSQKTSVAEQKKKAEAKLSKLKDITSVAYITPQEQLDKNSVKFTPAAAPISSSSAAPTSSTSAAPA